MEGTKERITVTVSKHLIEDVLRKTGCDINDIDKIVEDFVYSALHTPNAETIAAIEESRAGKYAGTIDTTSMESFMKSMGI